MDIDAILTGAGYGAAYTAVGIGLLALGFFVLDLLTPGHLGRHITSHGSDTQASEGAGTVAGAWMLAQGLVLFTAIWTNADSSFGQELVATVVFGLLGIVLLAAAFVVLDLITPGRLGDAVCVPGPIVPLARLTACMLLAIAGIVCASIA